MKNNIVLSNEVDQFCICVIPIGLPVFLIIDRPLFCCTDIADGSIKPYVQYFAFCLSQGHAYPPIQVPCYCTRLQSSIQPAFALPQYICLPVVLMLLKYPLPQPAFMSFTLIAVSILVSADRAGTRDITICQECLCLFIIILFRFFYFQVTFII